MGYYTPLLTQHVLNAHRAIIMEAISDLPMMGHQSLAAVLDDALSDIQKFNATPRAEMTLDTQFAAVAKARDAATRLASWGVGDPDYRAMRASNAFSHLADYVADCFLVYLADVRMEHRRSKGQVSSNQGTGD